MNAPAGKITPVWMHRIRACIVLRAVHRLRAEFAELVSPTIVDLPLKSVCDLELRCLRPLQCISGWLRRKNRARTRSYTSRRDRNRRCRCERLEVHIPSIEAGFHSFQAAVSSMEAKVSSVP